MATAPVTCPITMDVPRDPVRDRIDGTVYDRHAIIAWLSRHHTSPMTRRPMTVADLERPQVVQPGAKRAKLGPASATTGPVAWPHQLEAIAALRAWTEPRGAFVMPPGSGKTMVMGLWGSESPLVIVCSPTRALAAQTLAAMGRLMPLHRNLLVDCDPAGTRDIPAVTAALAGPEPLLLSVTYASMCDIVADLVPPGGVVLVDEGHHLVDNASLRAAIGRLHCPVLAVTGTPSPALLGDYPIVYEYGYDRAVLDGRICDYVVHLPHHGDLPSDPTVVDQCRFLCAGLSRTGSTRCILYATTVEEAKELSVAVAMVAAAQRVVVWIGVITGDTSAAAREQQLKKFQAPDPAYTWFVLCSVRVLNEGIDVPACDAVYMANGIGSPARFIQRICRANRLDYPGKVANVFVWSDNVDATRRDAARIADCLGRRRPLALAARPAPAVGGRPGPAFAAPAAAFAAPAFAAPIDEDATRAIIESIKLDASRVVLDEELLTLLFNAVDTYHWAATDFEFRVAFERLLRRL
jgi:superfamily II DNA or RNA helicase